MLSEATPRLPVGARGALRRPLATNRPKQTFPRGRPGELLVPPTHADGLSSPQCRCRCLLHSPGPAGRACGRCPTSLGYMMPKPAAVSKRRLPAPSSSFVQRRSSESLENICGFRPHTWRGPAPSPTATASTGAASRNLCSLASRKSPSQTPENANSARLSPPGPCGGPVLCAPSSSGPTVRPQRPSGLRSPSFAR